MELSCGSHDRSRTLNRGLRIEDPKTLLGRKLGLKLRSMDIWWVKRTVEELFAGKDKVAKDVYGNPFVVQSAERVAISIET